MSKLEYAGWEPTAFQFPLTRGSFDPSQTEVLAAMDAMLPPGVVLPSVSQVAAEEFRGITTDGHPVAGLQPRRDEKFDQQASVEAARRFLDSLGAEVDQAQRPLDAVEWRLWTNAFLSFPEHGLLLDEATVEQRELGLSVIAATLSSTGYATTREAMRLNGMLGELIGTDRYPDSLTEFCYRLTIFGVPSSTEPWGWQLAGHHLDLHALIWGSQVVLTPAFVGAEVESQLIFEPHRSTARAFLGGLRAPQRAQAVIHDSMLSADLPPSLANIIDGRHRAGAARDNLVLPYEGIAGNDLTAGQRELLLEMTAPYLASLPEGPRHVRHADIAAHLEDTWVTWIGGSGEDDPFYYRIHSPVILIEYDNHAGVFLSNPEPETFHVHTIVRTPNGGDYGKSLLREHYHRHH